VNGVGDLVDLVFGVLHVVVHRVKHGLASVHLVEGKVNERNKKWKKIEKKKKWNVLTPFSVKTRHTYASRHYKMWETYKNRSHLIVGNYTTRYNPVVIPIDQMSSHFSLHLELLCFWHK
jgi:hypothetical protein